MRRFARNLWPCLALVFAACSLVVDFPKPRRDAGGNGQGDAGRDAAPGQDTGPEDGGEPDAQRCNTSSHDGCADDELCCDRLDGMGPVCVKTSASECGECGRACTDSAAPNCGSRECECEPGSAGSCPTGQRCATEGGMARCVECESDDHCTGDAKHCVANRCEQCDRGSLLDDSSDDEGCPAISPICDANNQCNGCTTTPNNCPADQRCNPGQGCSGCSLPDTAGVRANGCTNRTLPICRSTIIAGVPMPQCQPCATNLECAPLPYCDSRTGACTNACDPDGAAGNNGCVGPSPFCKATQGDFECQACVAADCSGSTPHCAISGARRGSCVACLSNEHCTSGSAPVCDATTLSCRQRGAMDCIGATPVFDTSTRNCVQCLSNSQCSGNANGNVCNEVTHTCVQCLTSSGCPASAPVCNAVNRCVGCTSDTNCLLGAPHCNTSTGECVGCTSDTQCSTATAPSNRPFCEGGSCTACNAPGVLNPDQRCEPSLGGERCVTSGSTAQIGRCADCDPSEDRGCMNMAICDPSNLRCETCDLATDRPCASLTPLTPQCVLPPGGVRGCHECDPVVPVCPAEQQCGLVLDTYRCILIDAGVPDAGLPDGG